MGYLHLSYLTSKYLGTFTNIFLLLSFATTKVRGQNLYVFNCLHIEPQVWSMPETILYSLYSAYILGSFGVECQIGSSL